MPISWGRTNSLRATPAGLETAMHKGSREERGQLTGHHGSNGVN